MPDERQRRLPQVSCAARPLTFTVEATDESGQQVATAIAGEAPLTLYVDTREIVTLMTLGQHPEALAIGYLRNQRLVGSIEDLTQVHVDWEVEAVAVSTRAGIADLLLQQLAGPVGLVWPGATGTPRAVLGLRARHADRVQFSGHWGYRAEGAGLTVVTAQAAEADRGVLTQLVADSQPFLVVRASDLGAIVGPLVAPGRSPCHRCEDLYRTSVDPAWPRLLAQLCRGRPPPERLTLHWVTSTAALHALSWLEGSLPDSIGAGLELAADRQVRLRPLRAHPACGCLAYG